MIYSVTTFNRDGKLKKKYLPKKLLTRHWQEFQKNEVRRQKEFTCGTKSANKILQEYRTLNILCDEFIYDHGRVF